MRALSWEDRQREGAEARRCAAREAAPQLLVPDLGESQAVAEPRASGLGGGLAGDFKAVGRGLPLRGRSYRLGPRRLRSLSPGSEAWAASYLLRLLRGPGVTAPQLCPVQVPWGLLQRPLAWGQKSHRRLGQLARCRPCGASRRWTRTRAAQQRALWSPPCWLGFPRKVAHGPLVPRAGGDERDCGATWAARCDAAGSVTCFQGRI